MSPIRAVLVILAALLVAGTTHAQAVQGMLVEEGSGRPVDGTLVVLLDAEGRQLGGVLTDASGGFRIQAPGPGRYRLKAERIGHVGTVSPSLELVQGQVLVYRMQTSAQVIELEGLVVTGSRRRCVVRPGVALEAATLWEEARKALATAAWTEEQRAHRFRILEHAREMDARTLQVRTEETREISGPSSSPYVSLPAEELARDGFVQVEKDATWYHAPDAHVLLSDVFLDGHCFRVQEGRREERGLIGLTFEPVRGTEERNVRGVLWLDRRTSELRYLEYGYTGLKLAGPMDQVGGRVEFERLPSGAWIVRRWRIRMPLVVSPREAPGLRGRRDRDHVVALREEGAEVLEIRTLAGEVVRAAERVSLTGMVLDSTRAAGLPGARVFLSGTPYAAHTDAAGRFRLADLPEGKYTVEFSHPRLDSLRASSRPREVVLRAGQANEALLAVPPLTQVFAALCPDAEPKTAAVVGTVRDAVQGGAVEGAKVVLSRNLWDVQNEQHQKPGASARGGRGSNVPVWITHKWSRTETETDARGRFRVCDVPAHAEVRLHVELPGFRGEEARLELAPGQIRTHDLLAPAALPAAR